MYYCTLQYIGTTNAASGETMATSKTTTLTFRIEPALKDGLRTAAEREHRSIANMVEVLIRDYCRRNCITIQDSHALVVNNQKTTCRSSK